MVKKKRSALRLRKLDRYSVIVTLLAVLVVVAIVATAAAVITRHSPKAYTTSGVRICNCPMIKPGAEPATICRC